MPWRVFPKNFFITNLNAGQLREMFLVAAVGAIIVIRVFLELTGYPQLGGREYHIAHIMWGGLFMLLALVLPLSFVSQTSLRMAAILGGIGFGTFIDELGKFVTRDYNYFYQPTLSIIYVIFVSIYVGFKVLESRTPSEREYLINAVEMVKEAVIVDLDDSEKQTAIAYLAKSNPSNPLTQSLKAYLESAESIRPPKSLYNNLRHVITTIYLKAAQSPLLVRFMSFFVIAQTLWILFTTIAQLNRGVQVGFAGYGKAISAGIALLFITGALIAFTLKLPWRGYRLIHAAVLILLFLTQFFQFYDNSMAALVGVLFNILLLTVVDYSLQKEKPLPTQQVRG